jgi:hypothetical protein
MANFLVMFLRHTLTQTSNVEKTAGTTARASAEGCRVRGAMLASRRPQ